MTIESHRIEVRTEGNTELVDITGRIEECIGSGKIRDGILTVFVVGSTAALTTTEYEQGLANHDFRAALERIAPEDGAYEHEKTWNDDNGHSHIRAGLIGPSLTVPLVSGRLTLGTWQQIVLLDFDTRPRRRELIIQVLGG